MTGSLNKSQHMAQVRSSLRLVLVDVARGAAAMVFSSTESVPSEEVKANAWRKRETGREERFLSEYSFS